MMSKLSNIVNFFKLKSLREPIVFVIKTEKHGNYSCDSLKPIRIDNCLLPIT